MISRLRLGLACALLLLCACTRSDPRPNLILVSLDTLRPDMMGCYGYDRPTTPVIDAMAARGVLFENTVSTAPWTLPAHASLFTGLYPSRHGLKSWDLSLSPDVATLAQTLAQHGWRTLGVVNSHSLSPLYGLHHGYQQFRYVQEAEEQVGPSRITRITRRWLRRLDGAPFFLFVHFFDIHSAYLSTSENRARFVAPYQGFVDGTTAQLEAIRRGELSPNPRDVQQLRDLYAAGIRQMDDDVGRLLEGIRELHLDRDTFVILTSDHGEEFLEHGGVLHGRTQYEEMLRVPLIVTGPGIPRETRVQQTVSLVDVLPTALGLLGLPPPPEIDGMDLSPLWQGLPAAHLAGRTFFGEADHNNVEEDTTRSVRSGRFKLLVDRGSGSETLYDLESDPGETRDVSREHPEAAERLRRELAAFDLVLPVSPPVPREENLSDEARQRLDALGYLE